MRLRIHRFDDTENNRINTSKELSENCLKVSEKLSEALSEGCPSLSEDCLSMSARCLRVSEISKKSLKDAFAAGIYTPSRILLNVCPIAVVAGAAYMTLQNRDAAMQIFLYLIGFGLMILFDTFRVIGYVLAFQSRILLSIDLFALAAGCIKPNIKYFVLVIVWAALSILVIKFTNRACIQTHNWVTAKSVQNAVAGNPKSKGFSVWENTGKNQARIVLSECGLHFSNEILDTYGMPLFLCGYYSAIHKNQKLKRSAEKAADMLDDLRYHNDDLVERNQVLQNQVKILQAEIDRLAADNQIYIARLKESGKQKNMNTQFSLPKVPEDTDERIKAMLRNGASIRDTATMCGVSKSKVEKIRSEIKGELSA